jgi:hypothetical protein
MSLTERSGGLAGLARGAGLPTLHTTPTAAAGGAPGDGGGIRSPASVTAVTARAAGAADQGANRSTRPAWCRRIRRRV